MMNKTFATAALATALLLAGCSDSETNDPHDAPRAVQSWENADLSGFDRVQLLGHLNLLANETTAAAAAGESGEFHHLEIALTATLTALEPQAAGHADALQSIESLKDLAIKLHIAGHDANVGMGAKLAAAIAKLSARLATEL